MDYLIDPEEFTTAQGCPTYNPCSTYCKIKPCYGIPIVEI